jgi:5-methylcytosine-specific restriction endonuclease McrA
MPHYYPEGLREAIAKRDGRTCRLCGKGKLYKRALTLDHIVPVSEGGKTQEDNLIVLCKPCNTRKGKKSLLGYVEHRIKEVEREFNILKETKEFFTGA